MLVHLLNLVKTGRRALNQFSSIPPSTQRTPTVYTRPPPPPEMRPGPGARTNYALRLALLCLALLVATLAPRPVGALEVRIGGREGRVGGSDAHRTPSRHECGAMTRKLERKLTRTHLPPIGLMSIDR